MTFRDNIEKVEISTKKSTADLLGVSGPSLKKLEIKGAKGVSLHNICGLIGRSKGSTFEVDINDTPNRLYQNQKCSGGRPQDSRRKIELQISNSMLEVQ